MKAIIVLFIVYGIVCQAACPMDTQSAWVRAVGDWPAAKGVAAWLADNPIGLMVFEDSSCTYKSDPITGLPVGANYQWKVTTYNSWNENYGCPSNPPDGNCFFTVPSSGTVVFRFNYKTKQLSVEGAQSNTPAPNTPAPTTTPTTAPVGSGKQVLAHFMMGNSYGYTQSQFQIDMNLAKAAGIDAFALNIGLDDWSTDRLEKAYSAAGVTNFKVCLSFDIEAAWKNAAPNDIINLIKRFGNYAGQYRYNGKIFVSTFGGATISYGFSSVDAAWNYIKTTLANQGYPIFFVPNFAFNPTSVYSSFPSIDGEFSWGAWPSPNSAVADDNLFMTAANNAGKVYMAPISPLFFTHLSYKNYLYDYDGLWFSRWQQLLNIKPHLIEIITWNDWGEAHYIAPIDPIEGDWPSGSADYVRGFDHSYLLDTLPYFISQYKNGFAPAVTRDIVVYWYRPHLAGSTASSDPLGRPRVYTQYMQDTQQPPSAYISDSVFVLTILRSSGTIQVNSGGVVTQQSVPAGANLYSTRLYPGSQTVTLSRGSQICQHTGAKSVTDYPAKYNFNIYVGGCKSN